MISAFSRYGRALIKSLPLVLIISFAISALAYFITVRQGPVHQVHYSYLISLSARQPTADYSFDGYYALQATELFAQTLAQWAQAPEVVVAAYQEAELPLPSEDPRKLTSSIKAEQAAPQLVQVTVKNSDSETASQLTSGLMAVMQRNIDLYHDQGAPTLHFRVVNTQPWLGTQHLAVNVIVAAAFVATFLITLNIVLLIASLK